MPLKNGTEQASRVIDQAALGFFAQDTKRVGHDSHWRPGSYNYDAPILQVQSLPSWVPIISQFVYVWRAREPPSELWNNDAFIAWLMKDACDMLSDFLGVPIDFEEVSFVYCQPSLVPVVQDESTLEKSLRATKADSFRWLSRERFTDVVIDHLSPSSLGCIICEELDACSNLLSRIKRSLQERHQSVAFIIMFPYESLLRADRRPIH